MKRVAQDEKQDAEKSKKRSNTAGQIISRGEDTWLVRIFMGRDGNGKRRYLNKTIRGKKKDAQDYLSNNLSAISTGTFVEPSPLTLDGYLTKWLESAARPRLRPHSFVSYEYLLTRHVRPSLGDKRLSDVRPLDIQKLYADMQAKGLSARTVRYAHAILSSALKQAVRWHMLARNPCDAVELPRQVRKEMRAFSPEEATEFLKAATSDRWSVLFALALITGMRPEEYLGLQWREVNLEKGIVSVCRVLMRHRKGGGWSFAEPKTPRSRRSIPLPASLIKALAAHRRRRAEERLKAGAEYHNHDLVFASYKGEPIHMRHLVRHHFKPILKRAKLPVSIRLYDLRHSCATLLLAANEHPKVVSERLGHASITLTLDIYSHVLPSMQQAASDKLESLLFATGTL